MLIAGQVDRAVSGTTRRSASGEDRFVMRSRSSWFTLTDDVERVAGRAFIKDPGVGRELPSLGVTFKDVEQPGVAPDWHGTS